MIVTPHSLALIYSEAYKAHYDKFPSDDWGARNKAQSALNDFIQWIKNNKYNLESI